MSNKIDVRRIVIDHFKTFYNYNTTKTSRSDWFWFVIIPVGIGVLLPLLKVTLDADVRRLVITCYAILIGLMFNINVLIFNRIETGQGDTVRDKLVKEMFANISFTILIAIIATILTIFSHYSAVSSGIINVVIEGIVYFLSAMFVLNLLMILQRMYFLFDDHVSE